MNIGRAAWLIIIGAGTVLALPLPAIAADTTTLPEIGRQEQVAVASVVDQATNSNSMPIAEILDARPVLAIGR